MKKVKVISDKELVKKALKGDTFSFEEIVKRYETRVYSTALRYSGNQADAQEILQEVFILVYRKLSSYAGKSAFSSWMHRITVNSAFMKLRKAKQNKSELFEDLNTNLKQEYYEAKGVNLNRADKKYLNNQLRDALSAAIRTLADEYKEVYMLRDVDGLSNEETAEMLEISIPAVKSRLHRARLMLRKQLTGIWKEYEKYGSDNEIILANRF